jgi:hypothetical protein
MAYPASLGLTTTDPLCTPLPAPIQLTGTGTQGQVLVSATSIAFGTDSTDPKGLVNCGATGLAHDVTVTNVGTQIFHVTGLNLGLGAGSPFKLSGTGTTLPAQLPIGGSVTITVTPSPIPKAVANPLDAAPFSDALTITTDAALDSPHTIQLVMQARGAVIADTPVSTTWSFGTVSIGSIGTFASTIHNVGNAAVSIALSGLAQPSIFGLTNNPMVGAGNAVTSIVGQFTPPASNGAWSDRGTLAVTTDQAFCEPLPAQWNSPTISLSGSSNSSPSVTVAGSLAFPNSDCGSPPPPAQSVTVTNATNVAYAYSARFNSGKYYGMSNAGPDGGAGTLVANGSVVFAVTPSAVLPGPDVAPGSAPYADDLLITVTSLGSDAGAIPVADFTIPISWMLNGAALSLPQGLGPNLDGTSPFYPADSTSGFVLPMTNTGTASASIDFAVQPAGAFAFTPAPPVHVLPNVGAAPQLSGTGSSSACPTRTKGTATFLYSGPVCRPFPFPSVAVESCAGTF